MDDSWTQETSWPLLGTLLLSSAQGLQFPPSSHISAHPSLAPEVRSPNPNSSEDKKETKPEQEGWLELLKEEEEEGRSKTQGLGRGGGGGGLMIRH